MTSIYSTGTVSVTNGNAVVAGSGTAWAVALVTGGSFSCAGLSIPILSVNSDISLTLAYAWPGTTAAGAAYAIQRDNSDAANVVDLYDKLTQLLIQLSLAGIHPDNSGTLAKRNALTLTASNDNYLYLHAEIGVAFAFYRWDGPSLAWVGPFPVADAVDGGGVSSIIGSGITVDSTNPAIPSLSITNDAVTNAKLANMTNATMKGRATAGTGDPEDLTATQIISLLGLGTAALKNTGTSGGNVPILNVSNTWGDSQIITTSSTNSTYIQLNNTAPGGQSWAFYSSGGGPSVAGNFGVFGNNSERLSITPNGLVTIPAGSFSRQAAVVKTADFTVAASENWLINFKAGSTCTVTLPSAATNVGREIMIKNLQAQTVVSASSNVVPLAGGAAGTAILAAVSGTPRWCTLVSNGTNWEIMTAN
ncbi:hypothetical protein RFN29_30610 [Mesorhizobium sp. VK22B]|uniref:Tail fiber protein n=1 Tax=Mesorhizobium captivum TaxID=3072319 RepID=A0ABU4Z9H8_9HYPH|nr:hypothetical protein [Mesorhizobium sp. VK22B]MDX8495899.1 hypothetical protein [Mesorhizobium sp. VK22B]